MTTSKLDFVEEDLELTADQLHERAMPQKVQRPVLESAARILPECDKTSDRASYWNRTINDIRAQHRGTSLLRSCGQPEPERVPEPMRAGRAITSRGGYRRRRICRKNSVRYCTVYVLRKRKGRRRRLGSCQNKAQQTGEVFTGLRCLDCRSL